MTSRQAGRRISTIASERRTVRGSRGGARQAGRRKSQPMDAREVRRLAQLVACGSIFVLLVAVKLLLPGKMAQLNEHLSAALRQNMDVQAVFSAVGRAFSGEADVGGTLQDVYQAVFQPQQPGEALETSSAAGLELAEGSAALDALRTYRSDAEEPLAPESQEGAVGEEPRAEVSTLAYVQYSDRNLPQNVSMEQALLGFDYETPVTGTLSSSFGYREHPVEGDEKFHYGLDIAADAGTAVGCFADGTVTAVGESSSYGRYCIVSHQGGYATLYAHCSRVTATSGAAVKEGQKIAEVGETGMATGPHLHFELHQNGTYLNPIYYVSLA